MSIHTARPGAGIGRQVRISAGVIEFMGLFAKYGSIWCLNIGSFAFIVPSLSLWLISSISAGRAWKWLGIIN